MDSLSSTMAFEGTLRLVAKCGGSDFLGDGIGLALEIFQRSLIGSDYPSFWLEVPLVGEPGFDLHVYYDRDRVRPREQFEEGHGFGMQALFDWYFGVETGGVGVGFAHDLRSPQVRTGAYVNFNNKPLVDEAGFFSALSAEGAHEHARALMRRMPDGWRPWYIGIYPERCDAGVRVGAFVSRGLQDAYARDPSMFAHDLERVDLRALDDEMLERIRAMAEMPYMLELQLDATEEGVGDTLGIDLTLRLDSAARACEAFSDGGAAMRACSLIEGWGAADERWRRIADVAFNKLVPVFIGDELAPMLMRCSPSFIKAKWVGAQLQPAKVYLKCDARLWDRA